ncbi:MAG: DUF481 domain-containing protein [Cyclobacteriaceae bacterium]
MIDRFNSRYSNWLYNLLLLLCSVGMSHLSFAQSDTLLFRNNNNIMVGEVKTMDRGVLQIETDYSDSDFEIEWEQIREIHTESTFLMQLSNGEQYIGRLASDSTGTITILSQYNGLRSSAHSDIVFLRPVKKGFSDRFNASIEFGTNLTKANSFRQYSSRVNASYLAEKWSSDLQFGTLRSVQNDADTIRRTDGALNYNFFLPHNRYISISITTLSNTEQKLDSRVNTKLGIGQYLIRTNSAYWGFRGGFNRSFETFDSDTPDRNSWEAYLGTELNLYDIGDFKLVTTAVAYPSLSESRRWRLDYTVDAKYEFDFDLYFKIGGTINYDNQPAEGATELDYVLQTSIGWEW